VKIRVHPWLENQVRCLAIARRRSLRRQTGTDKILTLDRRGFSSFRFGNRRFKLLLDPLRPRDAADSRLAVSSGPSAICAEVQEALAFSSYLFYC